MAYGLVPWLLSLFVALFEGLPLPFPVILELDEELEPKYKQKKGPAPKMLGHKLCHVWNKASGFYYNVLSCKGCKASSGAAWSTKYPGATSAGAAEPRTKATAEAPVTNRGPLGRTDPEEGSEAAAATAASVAWGAKGGSSSASGPLAFLGGPRQAARALVKEKVSS